MKILVVGSSINIGSAAWPNQLQKILDCQVVNLSMVGSGNTYTHHTIISEISKRDYDLVIPMWNNYLWMDFRNATHRRCEDPLDNLNPHKHLVNTSWMFDKTELLGPEYQNKKNLLYQLHHQFYGKSLYLESTLINVISTQGVLEANHIPYIHCFYRKLKPLKRFENLYQLINQENVYPINLYDMALENNWWDGDHPTANAHEPYAVELAEYIKKSYQ
jgi:hypothetical protein